MPKRRITAEGDVERLSEAIYSQYGGHIFDRASFDRAWNDFFEGTATNDSQNTRLRNSVYSEMRQKHPLIGRTFEKQQELPRGDPRKKYNYDYVAKRGNKIIYARRVEIKKDGKVRFVYRGRDGKFARRV